jgi:hypothetical protein
MAARQKRQALSDAKPTRSKATFDLPPELVAELRTASVLAGETLASIAERGLSAELKRLRGCEITDPAGHPVIVMRQGESEDFSHLTVTGYLYIDRRNGGWKSLKGTFIQNEVFWLSCFSSGKISTGKRLN